MRFGASVCDIIFSLNIRFAKSPVRIMLINGENPNAFEYTSSGTCKSGRNVESVLPQAIEENCKSLAS